MTDARGLRPIACAGRKHFDVDADAAGLARVVCRDRRCRLGDEVVVHTFDLATGQLVETRRYARVRLSSEAQPICSA